MKLIYILLFLLGTYSRVFAQDTFFDYPIKPGSDQWKSLKTHAEKVRVCQLPQNYINLVSTQALAETCLRYPLFLDVFAFNNVRQGWAAIKPRFNGFQELSRRVDASDALYNYYLILQPNQAVNFASDIEKGKYTFKLMYLEVLLADDDILANTSTDKCKRIIRELLKKLDEKSTLPSYYGGKSNINSLWVIGKIINIRGRGFVEKREYKRKFAAFLEDPSYIEYAMAEDIVTQAQQFSQP
jgi:hypothetical protein